MKLSEGQWAIKKEFRKYGWDIDWDIEDDGKHRNVLWHTGGISSMYGLYKGHECSVYLSADGDVKGSIFDKDEEEIDSFYTAVQEDAASETLSKHFNSGKKLEKAIGKGRVCLDRNNWVQPYVTIDDEEYNDLDDVMDDDVICGTHPKDVFYLLDKILEREEEK